MTTKEQETKHNEKLRDTNGKDVEVIKKDLGETVEGKPRKQAVSITYTLKAFGTNIDKLKQAGLIDDEQDVKLHEIRKEIVRAWTEKQFM